MVDALGVTFEGGEDFTRFPIVKLDVLVVAAGEELAWVGGRERYRGDAGWRGSMKGWNSVN